MAVTHDFQECLSSKSDVFIVWILVETEDHSCTEGPTGCCRRRSLYSGLVSAKE